MNNLSDSVTQMFGIESSDPDLHRAEKQLSNDVEMLETLISARESKYPAIDEFARISGIRRDYLERFEHDPVDFSLEFVRLYALSLGAEVTHSVQMY